MNADGDHEIDWIKNSSFEFWFEILCANDENDIYLTRYVEGGGFLLFRIKHKVPKN